MNNKFNKDNTPNAAKLMESLRYSGYDNNIALADLIDNSLDANASQIDLKIARESNKEWTISIVDNGGGMDEAILSQALRLGSDTVRDIESDLGRFGMGLVTASISIARRIEVYTKQDDGEILVSIMDLDEMIKNNSFSVYREKASVAEKDFANAFGLKNHGTLLILKKCDMITRPDPTEFIDTLVRYLGEIYRYFIRSGRIIRVNGREVNVVDPMWQDGTLVDEYKQQGEVFSDETYEIKVEGSDIKETFSVKIFILPQFEVGVMRKLKINQNNQGFYVMRNYRQIARASLLGLWDRHNDLNRVRAEIAFSGQLDGPMGVNYTKHDVKPIQAVIDKLQNDIMPQIETLGKRFKKITRVTEGSTLTFDEAEKIIAQKAKLLDKAEDQVKKPKPLIPIKKRLSTDRNKDTIIPRRGRPSLAGVARFEDHHFGNTGPIFDVEKQGKITVIQWNVDHPFYERFLLEYKENADLINAISFFAYSIGESKLKYSREDTYEMLENIMSTISTNLRVLLS